MRSTLPIRRLLIVGTIVALPVSGYAQEATISGTVTDSMGFVLPGVMVKAVCVGTFQVTGELQGFFRDAKFNAADFIEQRVLPYSNRQVSGTFGGPIIRDRLHFFANYEREREPQTGALVPEDILPISVSPTDQKLIGTLRELLASSATFRQMVAVLKESPDVFVLLRSSHELEPGLGGRGRFSVGPRKIVAIFEIALGGRRKAAVAHEIAHAVEVACLPGINDLEDLHRLLLERAGLPTSRSRLLPIETPFPIAVQRIVLRELAGGDVKAGQLAEVAARYGLSWSDDEPVAATPQTRSEVCSSARVP